MPEKNLGSANVEIRATRDKLATDLDKAKADIGEWAKESEAAAGSVSGGFDKVGSSAKKAAEDTGGIYKGIEKATSEVTKFLGIVGVLAAAVAGLKAAWDAFKSSVSESVDEAKALREEVEKGQESRKKAATDEATIRKQINELRLKETELLEKIGRFDSDGIERFKKALKTTGTDALEELDRLSVARQRLERELGSIQLDTAEENAKKQEELDKKRIDETRKLQAEAYRELSKIQIQNIEDEQQRREFAIQFEIDQARKAVAEKFRDLGDETVNRIVSEIEAQGSARLKALAVEFRNKEAEENQKALTKALEAATRKMDEQIKAFNDNTNAVNKLSGISQGPFGASIGSAGATIQLGLA